MKNAVGEGGRSADTQDTAEQAAPQISVDIQRGFAEKNLQTNNYTQNVPQYGQFPSLKLYSLLPVASPPPGYLTGYPGWGGCPEYLF